MVRHEKDIAPVKIEGEGISGISKQILIGPKDGYQGFLRVFTVAPGGNTSSHQHPWYHANYVLEGSGKIVMEGKEYPVFKGSVAYIPGNTMHQFVNTSNEDLKFICLVPEEGDRYQ